MSAQIEDQIVIRLMKDRKLARISTDQIVVVNSRDRDKKQFQEIVRSIKHMDLLIPVIVNKRYLSKTGKYELVCGEGRLIAHRQLNKLDIEAEVIDEDRKHAHLVSLIENIARVPPGTIWFAKEALRMRDSGLALQQIALITGRSESYVYSYLSLAEKGEARLIRGVEHGFFPIAFACRVADAGNSGIQNILMDAYDANIVTTVNFTQIKRILNNRFPTTDHGDGNCKHQTYTVGQLRRDIARVTREKESYIREAERKENCLFAIVGALETLMASPDFVKLLEDEKLKDRPTLSGSYAAYHGIELTVSTAERNGEQHGNGNGK